MKKFNKSVSFFLTIIILINTLAVGVFATVTTPQTTDNVLNKSNIIVGEFKPSENEINPHPPIYYVPLDADGNLDVDQKVLLSINFHYKMKYKMFDTLSNRFIVTITGVTGYSGEVDVEGIITKNYPATFRVSTTKDIAPDDKSLPRSYSFLDKIIFNVNQLPGTPGKLHIYYDGTSIHSESVSTKSHTIAYDTALGGVPIGENMAFSIAWEEKDPNGPGTILTFITLPGFNLSPFNLANAIIEEIAPHTIDGTKYTPFIYLKGSDTSDNKNSLNNNTNCKIEWFDNEHENAPPTYDPRAVITGQNNFIGQLIVPLRMVPPEVIVPSGIAVDRADKLYTYGDEIIMTAYIRSGANTNNVASFWANYPELGGAKILLGTAPVVYNGSNGTATLNYQTIGKDLMVYVEGDQSTTNNIVVTFSSSGSDTAAEVKGVIMRPKPIDVVVHAKNKIYDGTNLAEIPTGPGSTNYTFVGRLLKDDIKVASNDIGTAIFGTDFNLQVPMDYYAGTDKPVIAKDFTVTGIHSKYYLYPTYAYGIANISKKYDSSLKVITSETDRSIYVVSSDAASFALQGANEIKLDNSIHDAHIGKIDLSVANVVDIDRGGIFETKPTIKDNLLSYKAKNLDVEDPAQKASCTLIVSSTNYTDVTTTINFTLINKKTATISGLSVDNKIYDGKPATLSGKAVISSQDGGLLVSAKDLVYNYQSSDGGAYSSTTPPTLPGTYYLVITLPSTAYGYYAKTVIPFGIDKATVVVSTPSYTIYQGQDTLPTIDMKMTGFVNNENASVFSVNTLKAVHSTPDSINANVFPISFTGEIVSDRYNIILSPGSLTITKVNRYPAVSPLPEKADKISVFIPAKSMPDGTDSFEELALSFSPVTAKDDRVLNSILSQKKGFRNYTKTDIKLIEIVSGAAKQPKGKVTISMPYPAGSDSSMNFSILHMYRDTKKMEIITPRKVVGGIQFDVSEFSPFVIGWEAVTQTEDTEFFIVNSQITTEAKKFLINVKESGRKASYALAKFFEGSNSEKSVTFNNPDVRIEFPKNGFKILEVKNSYDFYAQKDGCEHELAARALGGEGVLAVAHFNHEGPWPGVATVSINVGKELKGQELAYYYYNDNENKLDYVTSATVDKDGWFTVLQEHCSDYVISSTFPKVIPSPTPTPTVAPDINPSPVDEDDSFLTKAWNFIKGIPAFIVSIPSRVSAIFESAKAFFTAFSQKAGEVFDWVKNVFEKISSPVIKVFGGIIDTVSNTFSSIFAKVSGFFSAIGDKIGDAFTSVKTAVGSALTNSISTVKSNPIIFILIVLLILAASAGGFLVIRKLKAKKAALSEDLLENTENSEKSASEDYGDDDEDKDGAPPKNAAATDDDIDY